MNKYYFVFYKDELLLECHEDGTYGIPLSNTPPIDTKPWTAIMHAGKINGTEALCYRLDAPIETTSRYTMCPLRQSYYKLEHDMYLQAGKCAELLYWNDNTKYCGVCGGMMEMHTTISKRCKECGKEVWPQLATAIIVLIRKGDKILLVHGRNFKRDFYGLVAGFVETGETLEDAVKRETKEETGLNIKNIKYFGSQPWPYPCGLMIGFTADYESGNLELQEEELSHGGWFDINNLPRIPEKLSIARMLIDKWIDDSAIV